MTVSTFSVLESPMGPDRLLKCYLWSGRVFLLHLSLTQNLCSNRNTCSTWAMKGEGLEVGYRWVIGDWKHTVEKRSRETDGWAWERFYLNWPCTLFIISSILCLHSICIVLDIIHFFSKPWNFEKKKDFFHLSYDLQPKDIVDYFNSSFLFPLFLASSGPLAVVPS